MSNTSKDGSSKKVSNNVTEEIPEDAESIEQLTKKGSLSVMELIKASNNLPIDQWDFFKTFPDFIGLIAPQSQKILATLNTVLRNQNIRGNVTRRDNEEKFEMIIEANDLILERVDFNLDELQGLKRNPEPIVGEVTAVDRRGKYWSKNRGNYHSLVTTRLNSRPQIKFKDKIDNRSLPFEPRIKEKPNALKPLAILLEKYDERGESFSHPYEYELDMFKPPEDQLQICTPQWPKPLEETLLRYVGTVEALNGMMTDLKQSKEIAVDVEHHWYRSFQGFTCLVQISTRDLDYIIDALELRHELHVLNEVFTDPKIVKVLHGAEHDIEWLQRDLSVYIVNMFDTHQAAQVLDFPRLGLAYLLKVFCKVDSNKKFQLYDWRTRPLLEEAVKYAREDTHYLLYVYDKLKNALIEKCQNKSNLLKTVINSSTDICKRKYWKDILTNDSHMELHRKSKKMFDNRQMYALKHLYHWRDKIAREEDESIMYVLPNHMLLNIAENLPREVQGISALCNPIPPLVKQHEREIHKIIFKAREQSLIKPIVDGDSLNQSLEMQPNWVPVNVDSKLFCPHDLSHCDDDIRKNLPTLLQRNLNALSSPAAVINNKFGSQLSPAIDVLFDGCQSDVGDCNTDLLKGKERQWKFVSPYQRYQKVMAFEHAEESKANKENSQSQNEVANTSAISDGASPAKIAKLAGPEEPRGAVEMDSKNDKGEGLKSTSTDNMSQISTITSITYKAGTATSNSNSDDLSNLKSKKKKKKKRDDKNVTDYSASPDKMVDKELPSHSIDDGDKNRDVTKETNEVIIPNLIEEGEITDNMPVTPKQSNKKSATTPLKKKKADDVIDNESTVDRKRTKTKDDFQPYDYNTFDFSKFHSNTAKQNQKKSSNSSSKKPQQGRRTPWLGNKKNIKKTISSLKK